MADAIILNLNELPITIIIKRLVEKSFKWSNYTLIQIHKQIEGKKMKTYTYQEISTEENLEWVYQYQIDFKTKLFSRDKERHFMINLATC